jgi:RNase P subunit RPR2
VNEYEGVRRVKFGGAQFIPVCKKCHRFVKADKTVWLHTSDSQPVEPNATCSKCGRTGMVFEGYV